MTSIWSLDAALAPRWTAYVANHPQATIFHGLEWREMLQRTFTHRPHYLLAEERGRVVGVLPLVEVRSMLPGVFVGVSLISVPFGVYGGIIADTPAVASQLAQAALNLAGHVRADYVELRHMYDPGVPATHRNNGYVTFLCDVPDTKDGCLERIPRKARAEVRKALAKPGFSIDTDSRDVEEFHRLFSANKRKLGSPVFPQSLFWRVFECFGDRCFILRVKHEGTTVAAVMSLIHRDTVMAYYSGATDAATAVSASNLLYHALMENACERGLKRFDFGRSRQDTGSYQFKKNQGFEPTPLFYDYLVPSGGRVPSLNPDDSKFSLARKVFRKLPPWAAAKVGSYITKRMPL